MPESDSLAPGSAPNPYLETIGGEAGRYGPETRLQLLRLVADGQTVAAACRALQVPRGAPFWWGRADPRYAVALAHARKAGAAAMAGDALDIADEPGLDRDGIQQARLRVATRQWMAARLDPEAWGERQQHAVTVHEGRRTAFRSFLGDRAIVEAEATVQQVEAAERNASDEALEAGRTGQEDDASGRASDREDR